MVQVRDPIVCGSQIPDTFDIVPNEDLGFTAVGTGLGTTKFHRAFPAGQTKQLRAGLPSNLAASAKGASVSGDAVNRQKLVDEAEATDWASLDGVVGKQITVDLAGDTAQLVTRANVSALLRPALAGDIDPDGQTRFSALAPFQILTCDDAVADCSTDTGYQAASPAGCLPGWRVPADRGAAEPALARHHAELRHPCAAGGDEQPVHRQLRCTPVSRTMTRARRPTARRRARSDLRYASRNCRSSAHDGEPGRWR